MGWKVCISCAGVTGSTRVGVLRIMRTQHCCLALRCLLKHSSLLVAFYFLQGSPSPCNLQNKLPLLRMPNSNTVRSVVFHCRGNTMATHYQHGITSKNTAHNIKHVHKCNRCMLCAMQEAVRSSTVLCGCTNVLRVCIHEF